ncbi:MAG: radical SAM protein [Halobacteria archaeon]
MTAPAHPGQEAPDGRRVLFTTPYRLKDPRLYGDTYDYPRFYQRRLLHTSGRRGGAAGLRFLRFNLPFVRILEFPTWREWMEALRSEQWDAIGFSFYTNEVPEVVEMARAARAVHPGVELWAGNYGAQTPGVEEVFDEMFIGYAEAEVGRRLGASLKEVRHPPLVGFTAFSGWKIIPTGVLYVTRGCAVGCTFCQTTFFQPKPEAVSLDSVRAVVEYYRALGIRKVVILDEFFGAVPKQAEAVIDLLHANGMKWRPQTRPNYLHKHLDDWAERGLSGCFIGIESFDDAVLRDWQKGYRGASQNLDLIRRLQERSMVITGYYIIGHESQDRARIKEELKFLRTLRLDTTQLNILTPLPATDSWREIEARFGISETDWHLWDNHHLVWNHPKVPKAEMEELLHWGLRHCHPNTGVVRTWIKSLQGFGGSYRGGLRFYLESALQAQRISYDQVNLFGGPRGLASEMRNLWPSRDEPLRFREPAGYAGSHSTRRAGYFVNSSLLSLPRRPGR